MCKKVKCAECHFLCSNYRETWSQNAKVMSVQQEDRPHLIAGKFPPSFVPEDGDIDDIPELRMSLRCWRGNWQADSDRDGCEKISCQIRNCDLFIPFEGDGQSFPAVIDDWKCEHKREVRIHDIEWGVIFFILGLLCALLFFL